MELRRVSLIRRYTGGGTVVVDSSTVFVSFIMNSADSSCQPYPREIMSWTENIYKPVFKKIIHRFEVSLIFSSPNLLHFICSINKEFSLREHDYVLDDKKIGGNAQTITKDRFTHHTSFLMNFDSDKMNFLQVIYFNL